MRNSISRAGKRRREEGKAEEGIQLHLFHIQGIKQSREDAVARGDTVHEGHGVWKRRQLVHANHGFSGVPES
jgi:hypothetical protein